MNEAWKWYKGLDENSGEKWIVRILIAFAIAIPIKAVVENSEEYKKSESVNVTTRYTGSSTTCSELQSEFNAAEARARSGNEKYRKGALGTMDEADSQMKLHGCLSRD